jgi:hypothetical protein
MSEKELSEREHKYNKIKNLIIQQSKLNNISLNNNYLEYFTNDIYNKASANKNFHSSELIYLIRQQLKNYKEVFLVNEKS